MRLHIHDGSGHPIAVQLSRELARRGHTVQHTYAPQWVSGHGRLTTGPDDPATLRIEGITARTAYDKYSPRRRIAWEVAYAKAWQRVLAREEWDIVILCNTQLITAAVMRRWLRRRRQPWVLWHQDIFAFAFADEAARKLPGPAAALAERLEGRPWLHVLGFQPAEDLPAMLTSGDVLVAILEPEASRFSIPSKVLTYLAAGRPILALTPESNPCVIDVTAGGGLVVAPTPKGAAAGA